MRCINYEAHFNAFNSITHIYYLLYHDIGKYAISHIPSNNIGKSTVSQVLSATT